MKALLLLLLWGLLLGCTAAPPPLPTPLLLWQETTRYGNEPRDYGSYSYLLYQAGPQHPLAWRKYQALVAAVQAVNDELQGDQRRLPRYMTNRFALPVDDNGRFMAVLQLHNPHLFHNPGPYLVTVLQPLSLQPAQPQAQMLYLDFSLVSEAQVTTLLREFKQELSLQPLQGREQLRSMRLSLLQRLLAAEDTIGLVLADGVTTPLKGHGNLRL
ncbi:hypothetical protein [uncultured Ferrimonas sp.]|uniref:hypothetical protein n=1 Tax=uncultured Ferrimonas sp. TaxID=432640 RepID=UPI0026155334|nr:hypothetical protein [uncultured Ferrimonas sp.]